MERWSQTLEQNPTQWGLARVNSFVTKSSGTWGKADLDLAAKVRGKSEETIREDGHTDVASAKNQVQIAMSALQKMQTELDKLGDEDELPTWWTNKVAVAVDKLDGSADYLDTKVEERAMSSKARLVFGPNHLIWQRQELEKKSIVKRLSIRSSFRKH